MFWTRNNGAWQSAHFKCKEFECKCSLCQQQMLDDQFLEMLEQVRVLYGKPITITSGYRCAKHQDDLRKQGAETAVGISSHQTGNAADITGSDIEGLRKAVEQVFTKYSIGSAKTWFHIDNRTGGPRRWSYK